MNTIERLAEARAAAFLRRVTPDDISVPGATPATMVYAIRRADEIFEKHGDPADGLRLSQVQLAAIIAGAHDDGIGGVE